MEKYLEEWKPINERLIRATFNSKFMKVAIVQCYAPKNVTEEGFLRTTSNSSQDPKENICIVIGDFKAKVGNENTNFVRTMGGKSISERNENGQRLVDFCSENGMVTTGTLFQNKDIPTWL